MGNNWTPEQLEAITQRDCNLLVAAAAGAGKTAVLVERIIRKITDSKKPVDIDRLLVVTFTNAAAAEMRERIGNALINALEADPASANLQNQMALLDRASIMTLHSFCLEVVRSHFHTLDLDPGFRISDETESTLMRLDTLDELFEDKYENEEADSEFFQLVDSYGGGRDDNALREIVLSLHRFTRSHPWPEQWLAAQAEAFDIGASACLSSTPWARVLLKSATAELQGLLALLEKAAALASRAQGLEPYCGVLACDMQLLEKLLHICQAAAKADSGDTAEPAAAAPDLDAIHAAACSSSTPVQSAGTAASVPDWDAIHAAFSSCEPARLPRCGKDVDTNAQDEVKAIRSQMKDKLKKLCESGFNLKSTELLDDCRRLYPLFKYLSAMVCEFDGLYSKKKKSKALLDFNDLEHYCLKVLLEDNKPTAAALELRKRYEEILVDEYQDSNLIQELILGTVSGNQDGRFNIFMVGDVKQSIYRFRQAKPELFLSKYSAYPHESGHNSRVIQLYKNFRSRSSVINGVNFIFRQVMSTLVGELDYTDEEALNPGAVFEEAAADCNTGGPVELHIIDVTSTAVIPEHGYGCSHPGDSSETSVGYSAENSTETRTDYSTSNPAGNPGNDSSAASDTDNTGDENVDSADENEEEPLDNIQAEARITGKRIRELVSHTASGLSIYDKKLGNYRKSQYRDIVILMRATRNWANVFVDELAAMGIPSYADTGLGYFRTVEVETMLSLLQIIDNPLQDIPLLAVLRSPIIGFNADELADIRLADRTASYFEAMRLFAGAVSDPSEECSSDETRQKTGKFLEKLQNWRDIAQFTPTDELVWKLLTDTGYYSYVGVLPGGPERQANLHMLFERARQFEETSYKGLFNFINFINKLRSGGGDMGSAKILGENDNVVRIMSIHKSKGLEFPIVIVSGCGRKFNLCDLNASILLHQELGYGPDIIDLEKRTIVPSLSKFAIRQKLRLETLSEEMRILYVAFTRAREKLIMTGCIRDVYKACSRWCSIADVEDPRLPSYNMQQAATYLEWLGPALARHRSAEPLRMAAAPHGDIKLLQEEGSCWEIKLWGMGAAAIEKEAALAVENIRQWLENDVREKDVCENDVIENDGSVPIVPGYSAEELIKKLEWEYPFKTLSGMPAKLSVTELKRRFAAEEQPEQQEAAMHYIQPMTSRPAFMEQERGLDAARRGSVMHFVMQHLDFKRLASLNEYSETGIKSSAESSEIIFHNELKSQLAAMEEKEQLSTVEAEAVNIPAIGAFFGTTLGKRMLAAKSVRRETAFNIEIKCTEIYGDLPRNLYGSETMLVQGVIDCWFEADDGIVLLDYKTDYVPAGGAEIIKERYRVQLDYYTRALERISGKKVTEKYLYLFHSGELLSC
jgi:ATP-dependent helicase/nuclease subunit A